MGGNVNGVGRAASNSAAHVTGNASGAKETAAYGPPKLGFAGLGVEGLAAMLSIESAQQSSKLLRDLEKVQGDEQVAAIAKQASELHEKASAIRDEGWISGIGTMAGGAMLASSACVSTPSVDAAANGAAASGGAADAAMSAQKTASDASARLADDLSKGGTMVAQLGGAISKAASAAQSDHDANAAVAAEHAKFAETAKDEYASLAKDANDAIAKAQDALTAFVQERMAAEKAIWAR